MATQTTAAMWAAYETGLPSLTQAVYNRQLLERAYPALLHAKFGQQKPLSKRSGNQMVFRRFERLGLATTPLTEGTTPTGTDLTYTNVTATIKQYGNFTVVSDMVDLTHYNDIIGEATELMGENMGETLDVIYREYLNAGTKYIGVATDNSGTYAATTTRTSVHGTICKSAIDTALNFLDRQNAKKYTTMIQGAAKDNTYPVAPSYWAIIHPDMERDLYNASHSGLTRNTDWVPVEQYAMQTQVMPTEVGKYRSVRFITSTHAKYWADAGATTDGTYRFTTDQGTDKADVYSCLIFAKDAFGIVPLSGASSRSIIHRAGGPGDPLNQRNTVGWKAATCAVILNQNYLYRIECASLA